MRIRVLSDLHEEFRHRLGPLALPRVEADVTVLAGDIGNGDDLVEVALRPEFDGTQRVLVPGNHEYYGTAIGPARARLREAVDRANAGASPGRGRLHLLDDGCAVIDGVRFVGGTLWTDYLLHGEAGRERALQLAQGVVTDFRAVQMEPGVPFTAEHSIALHMAGRAYLEQALAEPFEGATVVVTHHAPHPGSVAARFAGNEVNPAFVSDLGALMGRAPLWIHGHTHDGFDYTVAGTRVVANPAGYRKRAPHLPLGFAFENQRFDPELVIDL